MSLLPSAIVWDPALSPFSLFGFEIRYYSLCWLIGLLGGYLIVKKLYKKQNIDEKLFDPLFFYCFLGILIGARLGHCLFYEPERYLSNPIDIILPMQDGKFTGFAGLASHGGVIGVIIALLLYVRKTKLKMVWTLDNLGIAAPFFAAMVRIGNFMNSEIIGTETDLPWGVVFKQAELTTPHHPAQLYEALAYLIIFFIGLWLYKRYSAKMGSGFFMGYCLFTIFTFRFFVEFIKENQVEFEDGMTLIMGQWLSIPLIAVGLYYLIKGIKSK